MRLHNQSFAKYLCQTGELSTARDIWDKMEVLQEDLIYASLAEQQRIGADIDAQRKHLEKLYKKYSRNVEDPQGYEAAVTDLKRQLMLASNSSKQQFTYF